MIAVVFGPWKQMDLYEHAHRLIFEGGVEYTRRHDGVLKLNQPGASSSSGASSTPSSSKRPILLTLLAADGREYDWLLPVHDGPFLDLAQHRFVTGSTPQRLISVWNAKKLAYLSGTVVHHCKRLAQQYAAILGQFLKVGMLGLESDRVIFTPSYEPYYEFDATLTGVIRLYEMLRFPLWSAFAPKHETPRSFKRLLDRRSLLPKPVSNRLQATEPWFHSAKSYRDCIEHYSPVDFGGPRADIHRTAEGIWRMSAPLPDNPTSRSPNAFVYSKKLDALTYAWELVDEVSKLAVFLFIEGSSESA